jgi:hypothetical protein
MKEKMEQLFNEDEGGVARWMTRWLEEDQKVSPTYL